MTTPPAPGSPTQQLKLAMLRVFDLPPDYDVTQANYRVTPGWDSVAHMQLVSTMEETFDIMLETADVLDMSSWNKALEILRKYGIGA